MTSRDTPFLTEEEEVHRRKEKQFYAHAVKNMPITHCVVTSKESDGSYVVETLSGGKIPGMLTYPFTLPIDTVGILYIEDGITKFVRKPPD